MTPPCGVPFLLALGGSRLLSSDISTIGALSQLLMSLITQLSVTLMRTHFNSLSCGILSKYPFRSGQRHRLLTDLV